MFLWLHDTGRSLLKEKITSDIGSTVKWKKNKKKVGQLTAIFTGHITEDTTKLIWCSDVWWKKNFCKWGNGEGWRCQEHGERQPTEGIFSDISFPSLLEDGD